MGELVIRRSGYDGTRGAGFTLATTGPWDGIFGVNGGVIAGTPGTQLFTGSNPLTAGFS